MRASEQSTVTTVETIQKTKLLYNGVSVAPGSLQGQHSLRHKPVYWSIVYTANKSKV